MADGEKSELDVLFPDQSIVIGGETITVSPFKFGQWPRAVKLGLPLVKAFNQSKLVSFAKEGDVVSYRIADDWVERIDQLLTEGGEPLMEFVAFAVGKKRDWLDTIAADDGIELVKKVFSVNIDFFNQKIMPKLPGLVNEKPVGGPSSPGLSTPVTDAETSTATP